MHKPSSKKKPTDINQLAASIMGQATGESAISLPKEKNPAAVALGRLGGLKGGRARANKLSKKEKQNIAKIAAEARWLKYRKSH